MLYAKAAKGKERIINIFFLTGIPWEVQNHKYSKIFIAVCGPKCSILEGLWLLISIAINDGS